MSPLLTFFLMLAVCVGVYANARSRGEWSWPAFFWILALILIYAGLCALVAFAVMTWLRPDNPALGTGLILLPVLLGVVPLAIVARRIYRHYVKAAR